MATLANTSFPHLFSPFTLAGKRLKNRIVHASMSTKYIAGSQVSDQLIAYHVNRAKGGAAITISEPMNTLKRHTNPVRVDAFSGKAHDGLSRWAEAMAAHDSLVMGQIQDAGRGRHEAGRNAGAIGASALPDGISWTVPHVLTASEVDQCIEEFAISGRRLKAAGFAGVEISAGHGHLFHQFLSAWSNRREDEYGGDTVGRARFVARLVQALRAECGSDFIVGLKLPGDDGEPGGVDAVEAGRITAHLADVAPPDYFTYCWGSHSDSLGWHLPDLHGPRAPFVETIKEIGSNAPGIPLGALGLITDPNEGERIVRDGLADLVMMGRPLVTDPAWGIKAEQGREAEIRYCVSCNTCWHMIVAGGTIQCDNNPRVGTPDEADWQPTRAEVRKKVAIVGAGIAGMEAAWVAAGRGHDVTVFGVGDEVGGKTRLHAYLPGGENLSSIYDYQRLRADRFGATFKLGKPAELEDVLAVSPDMVVLATGSTPDWPDFLPAEYRGEGFFPDLREAVASLLDVTQKQPGRAVIYDHDSGAFVYAAAEFLMDRFEAVTIITPRERIASDEPLVNRQGIYPRLYRKGVEIILLSEPLASSQFEEGRISYANVFTGQEGTIEDVSLFTYATSRVPNDALAAPLRAAGIEVQIIGDAYAPRSVLTSTGEGYRAAMAI